MTATAELPPPSVAARPDDVRVRSSSVRILVGLWLLLHLGCLFTPGLLDDVDSIYIEAAREMLVRHDYVTPYVDGVRFFDKPPLMYWMAAGSMKVFGPHDWAARLPLSLCVLALFLCVYALGKRLYGERGGFYAALAIATSLGPYLFTRFYIPDILNALWMTLGVHLFLVGLDRARSGGRTLVPTVCFALVMALNLLTKGLIGLVFPLGFVVLYALLTGQLRQLRRMHPMSGLVAFVAVALPWHLLAAWRNPAISVPGGMGLPARAGWAWFYLVNEHFLRFRGLRIPHDYGQLPIPLFWAMFFLWLMPWAVFLPGAARWCLQVRQYRRSVPARSIEAALTPVLWAAMVLGFFTLSSRQEYYSLPALPALALLAGCAMVAAERGDVPVARSLLRWSAWLLVPLAVLISVVCGTLGIISPSARAGADVSEVLTSNPDQYNLALGHLHDLTVRAMGFFRAPLLGVAVSMLAVGPLAWSLRRRGHTYAANLTLAAGMCGVLLCVHSGLARFYPIIGSKGLALDIAHDLGSEDGVWLDGELTSGSTLLFYTRHQLVLVNGRVNGPWFGSFWPDAPPIFADDAALHRAWIGRQRIFLLTYSLDREADLRKLGPTRVFAASGGKMVLTNR